MGAEMYEGMSALQEPSEVIQRGIALHKMIRAVTMVGRSAGEGRGEDFEAQGPGAAAAAGCPFACVPAAPRY